MAPTYLTVKLGTGLRGPGGQQLLGKVRFTPNARMVNGTVTIGAVERAINADGTLDGPVAATNDPGTDPNNGAYLIQVLPRGGEGWSFYAALPYNAPGGVVDLNDLDELEEAPPLVSSALAAHIADTTDVHGIADTSALETTTGSAAKVTAHAGATDPHGDRAYADGLVAAHAADTTSVHGITDTSALATTSAVETAVVTTGWRLLPAASGGDDTAALQAVLDSSGRVRGRPGASYVISAPLVISSGTELDMTGCTITSASGSTEGTMLIDTGHNAMLFQAGSWTAPSNITVIGGYWDGGNVAGSTGLSQCKFILGGSRITVRGCTFHSTNGKFAVLMQNATDFTVQDIYLDSTKSDGVHVHGPAARGIIRNIRGTTNDDLVSIVPIDWTGYTWGNEGDVTDLIIENIQGINCKTNLVKVLGGTASGTPLNTKRITIRNVSGNIVTGATFGPIAGIFIGDDTAQPSTTGGQIHDVVVDGVSIDLVANSPSPLPIIYVPGNSSSLPIKSLTVRNVYMQTDVSAIARISGKVDALTIDGVTGGTAANPIVNAMIWLAGATAMARRVRLANIDITFAGSRDGAFIYAADETMTLDDVAVFNCRTSNVAQGFDLGTNTRLRFVNLRMVNNQNFGFLRKTGRVQLSGSGIDVDSTNMSIQATARTDTVTNSSGSSTITDASIVSGDAGKRVTGTGVPADSFVGTVTAGVSFVLVNASGTPVVTTSAVSSVKLGGVLIGRGFDVPLDVSLPSVLPSTGDRCYNTDSGQAGGVGPVIYTGSAWARVA